MSDPGTPEPSTPAPTKQSSAGRWVLALVIVLILGGGGFFAYTQLSDDSSKVSYPAKWDARILPYVKIVEKERGLSFKHPVAVRFLTPEEFEKGVRSDKSDLSAKDRKELGQFTGMMRAIGLVSGNVDLFKAFNDVHGSGTLAYYSFTDQRVTIRGKTLTPASKSTLVHELTHALQDQRFDIGARVKALEKLDKDNKGTDTASSVLDAIIEGDAERIETKYRDSLTQQEQAALDRSQAEQNNAAADQLKAVPKVVLTIVGAPYTLGEALLQAVDQNGGNSAVDRLFVSPPKHEVSLIDPLKVLAGPIPTIDVDVPKLDDGEKSFETGEFGALTLYVMLAERLPLKKALAAADGWGGDSSVGYERDGTSCVKINLEGSTNTDTVRIKTALGSWITAVPGSSATVTEDGDFVRFQSCDPGTSGPAGNDASQEAIALDSVRTYLAINFLKIGAPVPASRCLADALTQEYTVAQLTDPSFGAHDPSVRAHTTELANACRSAS